MAIIPRKIDYRPLDEWRKYFGIYYKDMAREVNVTPSALSHYRACGLPFPSNWIAKWQDCYKLTRHDIGELFYTKLEA